MSDPGRHNSARRREKSGLAPSAEPRRARRRLERRDASLLSPRRGFTLVELLVVVGIILLMTAIALPTLNTGLKTRRMREAARGITAYFGATKSHAVQRQRPVGVLFERLEQQPQACTVLREVEVPPPYAGDTVDAAVVVQMAAPNPPSLSVQARVPAGCFSDGLVRPFDRIQFNHQGPYYAIAPINPPTFNDDADGDGFIDFTDGDSDGWCDVPLMTYIDASQGYTPPWPAANWSAPVPFVIERRPVPTPADPLPLPRGTVVDLAASGMDSLLYEPEQWTFEPQSQNVYRPVVVMFSPNGVVGEVYYSRRKYDSSGNFLACVYEPRRVTGPIHFLVGLWERMPAEARDLTVATPGPMAPTLAEDGLYNRQDANNLWVALNPQTGLATVAQVYANALDPTRNVYVPSPTGGTMADQLRTARTYARQAQISKGGR